MSVRTAEPLEAARTALHLTVSDLWFEYACLGGNLALKELDDFLAGDGVVSDADYNVIAQALNERFMERDQDHPVAYADEL